jgi:hypothetical protein
MVLRCYSSITRIAIPGVKLQMDQCILSSRGFEIGMKLKSLFSLGHMLRDEKLLKASALKNPEHRERT